MVSAICGAFFFYPLIMSGRKEPPILVVNKPRKRKRSTVVRTVNKRKTTARKDKKPVRKSKFPRLRLWLGRLLMAIVVLGAVAVFYTWFIEPYAYRWRFYDITNLGDDALRRRYSVHGFDVSHHQGNIDWGEIRRAVDQTDTPIRFVFIKATEGGDFVDKRFAKNFKQAREYGFLRGAYHFYQPSTAPELQAANFVSQVELVSGDLPPVLDIEVKPVDVAKLRADLLIWLRRIKEFYGAKPIIYTSYKYKMDYLSGKEFDEYPFWIAHYYTDSVRYEGMWHFWQHSDMGKLPGIRKNVDLNVFNGTLRELQELLVP